MPHPTDVFKKINMTPNATGCWEWLGSWAGRERHRVPDWKDTTGRITAYRRVYELVHGVTLTREQMILHSCDNGNAPIGCCNPAHLSIGDNKQNMKEMSERQRHGLPHNTIRVIKRLIDEGRPNVMIADLYGVSPELISAIKNGRAYAHVEQDETLVDNNPDDVLQ